MNDGKVLEMFAQLLQVQMDISGELGKVKNEIRQLSAKAEGEVIDKIGRLYDAR